MKAVLISIQPKWVEKIASGRKTIEVRKTAPKQVPFKCYIYCTFPKKPAYTLWLNRRTKNKFLADGKVIGEFICDGIAEFESEFHDDNSTEQLRRVWYDEDDGERDAELFAEDGDPNYLCTDACLTWDELKNYVGIGDRTFYGWHISDLKIYDKPKELTEFANALSNRDIRCKHIEKRQTVNGRQYMKCTLQNCICEFRRLGWQTDCIGYEMLKERKPITRAPQSWQYVEE